MVSKASEDFPEPERPVMTIRLSRGRSTSTPLRLCSRAPRTEIWVRLMRCVLSSFFWGCQTGNRNRQRPRGGGRALFGLFLPTGHRMHVVCRLHCVVERPTRRFADDICRAVEPAFFAGGAAITLLAGGNCAPFPIS